METEFKETNTLDEIIVEKELTDSTQLNDDNFEKISNENSDENSENKDDTTIEMRQQNVDSLKQETNDSHRPEGTAAENGKKKKEEKPPTKIVVRRLPPTMTEENFLEQVSPIPPHDYMYFVQGDPTNGVYSFSRAYINFTNQEDIFTFTQTFDNYVFFDTKGQEYPAVVEFAPFQRVPKQRTKKKDALCGTIECDPLYIAFKENLQAEALENSKPGATVKQHYFETEISTSEEVNTTPLLEFLKQKKAEKARIRDEKREEKKRKDSERKMKQKVKDKKTEGEEDEAKDVKIQCNPNFKAVKTNNLNEIDETASGNNLEKDKCLKPVNKDKVSDNPVSNIQESSFPFKTGSQIRAKSASTVRDKSFLKTHKDSSLLNPVSGDRLKTKEEKQNEKSLIGDQVKPVVVEKKVNDKSKFTAVVNLDKKQQDNAKSDTRDKIFEMLECQKAEQQSQYLRKILGISSTENINKVEHKTESTDQKSQDLLKIKSNPKLVVTSQSQHNINPALPSASFKNSSKLSGSQTNILPVPQPGTPPFPTVKKESTQSSDLSGTRTEVIKNPLKLSGEVKPDKTTGFVDPSIVTISESRPLRGEVVIDKALSTNNVLPSAFKKIQNKPS